MNEEFEKRLVDFINKAVAEKSRGHKQTVAIEGSEIINELLSQFKSAKADALDEYRNDLIAAQIEQYGIVLPDVADIADGLSERADEYRNA